MASAEEGIKTPVEGESPVVEGSTDEAAAAKPKELSKKELRKLERERQAREAAEKKAAEDAENFKFFGELPIIQSTILSGRVWSK
jgi:hypothetical protein